MTQFFIWFSVILVLILIYLIMGTLMYKRVSFNVWSKEIRYMVTALFAWVFLIALFGSGFAYFLGENYDEKWRWVAIVLTVILSLLILAFNVRKLYNLNIKCENKVIAIIFTVLQAIVSPIVLLSFLIIFLVKLGMSLHKPQNKREKEVVETVECEIVEQKNSEEK